MRIISKYSIQGLLAVFPLLLTAYILSRLAVTAEKLGFTVILLKSKVGAVNMNIGRAMRFTLAAALSTKQKPACPQDKSDGIAAWLVRVLRERRLMLLAGFIYVA